MNENDQFNLHIGRISKAFQNPKYWIDMRFKTYWRFTRYGLTKQDFDFLVWLQNKKCAICQKEKMLCVDHDHKTGELRALICKRCNRDIGQIESLWFESAKRYLKLL